MEADRKLGEAWLKEHKEDDANEFRRIAIMNDQIAALLSMQNATGQETVRALQRIADQEHELPLAFGPPIVPKPTDELLGEMYLRLQSPAAARKLFEADLARAPGRTLAVKGLEAAQLQLAALPKGKDADKERPAAADHVHHHLESNTSTARWHHEDSINLLRGVGHVSGSDLQAEASGSFGKGTD